MSFKTPFARVRGLGSAKSGTGHWWSQRLTALALIPLALWFAASLAALSGADYLTIRAWIASPMVATLLLLLVTATFYHAYLGVQVVIEDYIHSEMAKLASLLVVKVFSIVLGLATTLSILSILFEG